MITPVAAQEPQQQQQQHQERPRGAAAAIKVQLMNFGGGQEDWEGNRASSEGRIDGAVAEELNASGIDIVRLRQARQA